MSRRWLNISGPGARGAAHDDLTLRFARQRDALRQDLNIPAKRHAATRALDQLHIEYAAARDPQTGNLRITRRTHVSGVDDLESLRELIAASLEGGLLRHSRRQRILAEARRIGISPFHAQLLIAQTQFGATRVLSPFELDRAEQESHAARVHARIASLLLLALAMFLVTLRVCNI